MNDWLNNFHFFRPLLLAGVIFAPLIYLMVFRPQIKQGFWRHHIPEKLLSPILFSPELQKKSSLKRMAFFAALLWIIACIAAAGPSWKKTETPVFQENSALVILLDLSPSMLSTDIQPSRVVAAQRKITDLLRARKDGYSALVVYSGDAHVVAPLTDDNKTIINMIDALTPDIMPLKGSNIESALQTAIEMIQQGGHRNGQVLLLTDGIDNDALPTMKTLLANSQIKLSIIGVGTAQATPLPNPETGSFFRDKNGNIIIPNMNETEIRAMANELKAVYSPIKLDDADIRRFTEKDAINADLSDTDSETGQQWMDSGFWFAPVIAIFFVFFFRKGLLFLLPVLFFFQPQNALSLSWDELWLNKEQLAEKALHQKDYEKALQYSKNPEILGASEYELGNYQQAEKHFSETPESDVSLYNKGNSLAKSLRFAEAIEAYDKALSVNPDNQNARFNRDLIEKIIKENEAQKQQQTSPSNEEHKSQDEQQNSAKEDNNAANSQADADNSDNSAQQNTNDSAAHKPDKSSTQNKPTANNSTEKNHSESESSSSESGTKKPQSEQKKQKDAAENTDSEDARRHPENNAQAGKKEAASSSQKDMPEKAAEETRYQDSSTVENFHDENPDTGNKSLIQDGLTEEQRQQVNQWLRQVPDDPSGLLKNKFDYYYRLNQQQGKVSEQDERW